MSSPSPKRSSPASGRSSIRSSESDMLIEKLRFLAFWYLVVGEMIGVDKRYEMRFL